MLNVCDDIIYQICTKRTDKRGTLYCSYNKNDDSNLLLSLPDYNDTDLFKKTYNKYSEVISKVLLLRVNVTLQMPVVLLSYKHKIHFFYIDNKHKLYFKCLSIYNLKKKG